MANTFILLSTLSLAFGAIAAPSVGTWFDRVRSMVTRRGKRSEMVADTPRILQDSGWTLIQCENDESFGRWLGRDELGLPPEDGEEASLGSHLLIEMYGCQGSMLEAEKYVGDAMRDAARASKATVVEQSFHEFKPWGVSGAVIIQESHYTIHTWPEHRYAAIDLFYCGGGVQVHRALDVLKERFLPERIKFLVVRRGIQSEVDR